MFLESNLIQEKEAKSLTFKFINNKYSIINNKILDKLKLESIQLNQTIRICMHTNTDDDLHNMIIAHPYNVYIRPHCNLKHSKSYHHIYGKMLMVGLDSENNELFRTVLSKENKVLRIQKGIYLYIKVLSDVSMFHEIALGPYEKDTTIYPSWAPCPSDKIGINNFIKEYKNGI